MNLFVFSWIWIQIQSPFCFKALIYIIGHHSFHCEAPLKKMNYQKNQPLLPLVWELDKMAFYLRFCSLDEDTTYFIYKCVFTLKAWLKMKVLVLIRLKHLNPEKNLHLNHYKYLLVLFWVYFCQRKLIPSGKIYMRQALLYYMMPQGFCI